MENDRKEIMSKEQMEKTIYKMAYEILEREPDLEKLLIIGIRTRGVPLANRLAKIIEEKEGQKIAKGELEIKLYQDDLRPIAEQPVVGKTLVQGNVNNRDVILVDDVLFTGRTVRAAISKIIEMGKPQRIELAVMIDRGWHKYPICADYVGKKISTTLDEEIQVRFSETDDLDAIFLREM